MGLVSFLPKDNPFETVIVDLTNRCNMSCKNCYIPDRDLPDIGSSVLLNAISQFPSRTNVRLAGAEPTLRRDLPELITGIRGLGHRVALMTNGLRLASQKYVRELKAAGLRHVYLSLNGANCDDWYLEIDQLSCASKKMKAFENLVSERMLLNTGTILLRGINEGAVHRMLELARNADVRHIVVKFRNVVALGRYDRTAESKNLSFDEMISLVSAASELSTDHIRKQNRVKQFTEESSVLFPLVEGTAAGTGVWVKVTDWQADSASQIDVGSKRRGQLTRNMRVSPFFESLSVAA